MVCEGRLPGRFQPRTAVGVGHGHAGRAVDEQDVVLARALGAVDLEGHDGVDEQQDGQELHQQQHVVAQPLEEAVDVQVLDALLPQEGAGHLERLALQLEKVEQQDKERHQQEDERRPPGNGDVVAEAEVFAHPAVDSVFFAEKAEARKTMPGTASRRRKPRTSGNQIPLRTGCGVNSGAGRRGFMDVSPKRTTEAQRTQREETQRKSRTVSSECSCLCACLLFSLCFFLCVLCASVVRLVFNELARVAAGTSAPAGRTAPGCW